MGQAHEQVRAATKSTARTQKSYFDKYVKGPPFHVGQLVWLYWPLPKLRQKNKRQKQVLIIRKLIVML